MYKFATLLCALALAGAPAEAATLIASTGNPDGLLGALSRPAGPSGPETETADDFLLTQATTITNATFVGLLPSMAALSSITDVEIELYNIFPLDSNNPPDGKVITRVNSPSDNQFAAFDSAAGGLTFSASILSTNFTVANSVVNGINPMPGQFTGGEGSKTGEEVQFNINFTPGFTLAAGHYFFRPEVGLSNGNFLWLSAPRPIVAPGIPFTGDLQAWIRNTGLDPDWERIGTDVTGQGTNNMTFSLSGNVAPEPGTMVLFGAAAGLFSVAGWIKRRQMKQK